MDIGKAHPQALVYPLTVAAKSNTPARKTAASKVLKSMCEHSNMLVQQALLVKISVSLHCFSSIFRAQQAVHFDVQMYLRFC